MEAALASAQRLVSAAERFGRTGPDDAEPGTEPGGPAPGRPAAGGAESGGAESGRAGSGGAASAETPVPAERDRPDPASGPDDGQPEPDLIPWSRTVDPVSKRKRRRAAAHEGNVSAGPGSHAPPGPGEHAPADGAGLDLRPVTNTELVARPTPELLLRPRRRVPSAGWRRTIYRSSLGLVLVPPGRLERRRLELIARARTPAGSGHHRVAILSMKGGVGKTTTTVTLGLMLASLRSDRIIAERAAPHRRARHRPGRAGRAVRGQMPCGGQDSLRSVPGPGRVGGAGSAGQRDVGRLLAASGRGRGRIHPPPGRT